MTDIALIDALAAEIRRVDGSHSLGAGALAEALAPFVAALLPSAADEWELIGYEYQHDETGRTTESWFADEDSARHWIDRYAAGIDEEPQMDRIAACLAGWVPPAEGWQPIETLPEGVAAVVTGPNSGNPENGYHTLIGSRYRGRIIDRTPDEANTDLGNPLAYITHWQPLPAAPSAAQPGATPDVAGTEFDQEPFA